MLERCVNRLKRVRARGSLREAGANYRAMAVIAALDEHLDEKARVEVTLTAASTAQCPGCWTPCACASRGMPMSAPAKGTATISGVSLDFDPSKAAPKDT